MRANEIQNLKGWKSLSDQMDLEKMLLTLVRYVRLQLGDEQDLLALVLDVLAPPLREEICNMLLLRADDVLEGGYALLFVLDYLRMKFQSRRQETMDCNRWRQVNMNFEQYCRLWRDICREHSNPLKGTFSRI